MDGLRDPDYAEEQTTMKKGCAVDAVNQHDYVISVH